MQIVDVSKTETSRPFYQSTACVLKSHYLRVCYFGESKRGSAHTHTHTRRLLSGGINCVCIQMMCHTESTSLYLKMGTEEQWDIRGRQREHELEQTLVKYGLGAGLKHTQRHRKKSPSPKLK